MRPSLDDGDAEDANCTRGPVGGSVYEDGAVARFPPAITRLVGAETQCPRQRMHPSSRDADEPRPAPAHRRLPPSRPATMDLVLRARVLEYPVEGLEHASPRPDARVVVAAAPHEQLIDAPSDIREQAIHATPRAPAHVLEEEQVGVAIAVHVPRPRVQEGNALGQVKRVPERPGGPPRPLPKHEPGGIERPVHQTNAAPLDGDLGHDSA